MGKQSKSSKYEVGYGKPPQAHQWVKGQSGNPSGKRKTKKVKPIPLIGQIAAQLDAPIAISVGGKKRAGTLGEAFAMKMFEQLMKATPELQLRALTVLSKSGLNQYQIQKQEEDEDEEGGGPYLTEEDRRLLEIVHREIHGT